MPRRGENIHKRKDGRWEARYKKGIDINGKTTYGSVYANTYREVKAKLQLKQQNLTSGVVSVKEYYTFRDAACLWLKDSLLSLKGASVYRYENLLNTHILPAFGNQRIDQLTGTDINAFLATKLVSGRVNGKGGLSPSYVRSIMLVIKAVLSYASENRMCVPLQNKISKPQVIAKELPVLTQNEQKLLVNMCLTQIDETKVCVLLSLYAGLRIGEICALEWEDIDIENRLIHVRKTVSRVSGTGENMATGSTATVLDNAYKFVGWYATADCTGTALSTDAHYTPTKSGELWTSATYYAKFECNLASLTIKKDGVSQYSSIDPNQTFIFNIKGNGIDLDVTVNGNNDWSTTINGLTVGQNYTITEKTDWSWRYNCGGWNYDQDNVSSINPGDIATITLGLNGTITFTNTRDENKWLDGDAYKDNHFNQN